MTEQNLSREDIRDVQCELLRQATHHLAGSCDARTAMIINKHELTREPLESQVPSHVAAAILTEADDQNQYAHLGPYAVLQEGDDIVDAVDIRTLLLNPDSRLRHEGLARLEHQAQAHQHVGQLFISPQTTGELSTFRSAVTSDDGRESIDACLKIADLLEHDFFYQISALRQATRIRMLGVVESKFRRVLTPSLEMMQFLERLPAHAPCHRSDEIEQHRRIILRANSLKEMLDEYFRLFGYLPLAGENSLAGVFRLWLEHHKAPHNIWEVVWNWTRENGSPIANYHACDLFCGHSELLTRGESELLVANIAEIILASSSNSRWKLRCRLARHYCQHLETLRSVTDGEQTSAAAWWLAEFVAPLYESLDENVATIANRISTDAADGSRSTWTIVRPNSTGSTLRYGTLYSESIWSVAILSVLSASEVIAVLDPKVMGFDTIETALMSLTYVSVLSSEEVGYAFENSTLSLAEHITKKISGSRQVEFKGFQAKLTSMRAPNEFASLLNDLSTDDDLAAKVVLHELRLKATIGTAPDSQLYELFSDDNWRTSVLTDGHEDNIGLICDAALELPIKDGKHDWRIFLPHVFATACEGAKKDTIREKLFDMVAVASLANNCMSGIQRLRSSDERNLYREYVTEWRSKLDKLGPIASPLTRARIRMLRAVLHIE